ncbi:MAG: SurA N-terminal domain-containing protein [Nitrospirae bacterium]|nr:SurA N-terminal domain-containing protein [Nitrospirota bacterium]
MKRLLFLVVAFVFVISCSKGMTEKSTQKGGDYLAKVNDSVITDETLKREMNALPPEVRDLFLQEAGIEGLIEELIKKELLYQEAKKKGYERSGELKDKIENFKKLMMIELLLNDMVDKKVTVSENDVRGYYEKNKADFVMTTGKKKEPVSFDMVKEILRQRLTAEKQKKAFESYLSSLENAYTIQRNKERISNLVNMPKPKP